MRRSVTKISDVASRYMGSGYVRNVGILALGTAAAQAIAVVSLPILTRLYTPEDFSALAVFIALLGVFATIGCLRFNMAITLPEDDADAMTLVVLSAVSASIMSAILLALAVFAPQFWVQILGKPDVPVLIWMLPLCVWAASLYNALQYWATRKKNFGLITKTRIARSVGGVVVQIGMGLMKSGPLGLILGQTANQSFGVVRLLRSLLQNDRPALGLVSMSRMKQVAQRYRNFPIFSVPEALFNTAGTQVPILIIAAFALEAEAGFVLLAMRFMGLPMGLVGSSVAQVYITEAPAKLRQGELGAFTRKTMWSLAKIGGIPLLIIGILAPFLFGPVFGEEWRRAGLIVCWMTPWFILQFLSSPVSVVLHVTGHLKESMFLQALGMVLRIGVVIFAAQAASPYLAEAYAVTGALFYGVYMWAVLAIAKKADGRQI